MSLVTDHLTALEIAYEVLPHAPADTALTEALALGTPPQEVVKTLVLRIATGDALAVLPADRRLDLDLVRDALGDPHARLATEDEVTHDLPAFEPGALPPLPSLLHLPVVLDPEVAERVTVVFPDGTQRASVRAVTAGLFVGAQVVVAPITATVPQPALVTG